VSMMDIPIMVYVSCVNGALLKVLCGMVHCCDSESTCLGLIFFNECNTALPLSCPCALTEHHTMRHIGGVEV
jgi:hypothetical protein